MLAFIYDCETTGLVKNSLVPLRHQPKVIEFFGHIVNDETGEVLEETEFFCDPGEPLEPVITRITGIKDEDLKGKLPFRSHCDRIYDQMERCEAAVAHNLSFDWALVQCEFDRCDRPLLWPPRLICTVEQTEHLKGHRLSLSALHEDLFGEPFKGAHRARHDVMALTRCYLELRKRGEL
jgi:DNA polymerase III epsilon subunit-like protein